MVIQKNDEIRLKIIGLRIDATDIVSSFIITFYAKLKTKSKIFVKYAIGTLRDDYLGRCLSLKQRERLRPSGG